MFFDKLLTQTNKINQVNRICDPSKFITTNKAKNILITCVRPLRGRMFIGLY
jgi:hypothetical protein